MIDWHAVDTILLDMDGTLIDLQFEWVLWHELLPRRFAAANGLSFKTASEQLFDDPPSGLELYSIPNWSSITGLDVVELHRVLIPLLRYLPNVEKFLETLRHQRFRTVIVTNAHSSSFILKNEVLDLSERVDAWHSSEHIGLPKEDPEFWIRLAKIEPFDPARTLFIDDTQKVLDSAKTAGIAQLLTVAQPDMTRPIRTHLAYPAIQDFRTLLRHD